jgi:nucleoside-diphosphate-sugar epimerase
MSKCLVTGGSGFLGSHLVDKLSSLGEYVRVLVRPTSDIEHLKKVKNVELVYGDLGDIQSLEKATAGIEYTFHCAALASDWGNWNDFYYVNVECVRNLLNVLVNSNIKRLIHISTTDVYGYPDYPADEDTPYKSRGIPYCDTKIEGEKLVWEYFKKHSLPVTVIRPVNIYGPRSITFGYDIVKLLKEGSMIHISNGNKPAGLAYVGNVVAAIILSLKNKKSIGRAYNICDGSDITWKKYVNYLAKITDNPRPKIVIPYKIAYFSGWLMEKFYSNFSIKGKPLLTRMAAELFGTNQGFPIEKARRELGYKPNVDFYEGMDNVKIWLHQIGLA